MYILIFSLISLLAGGIVWEGTHNASLPSFSPPAITNLKGSQEATLFELYREAVNNYVSDNPGFSGTVPSGSLNLPAGTVVTSSFSNEVSSGTAWSWITPGSMVSPSSILSSLSAKSKDSLLVGLNQNGTLFSPISGSTGISVPATVPNGALVSLWESSTQGSPPPPSGTWPQEQSSSSSYSAYDGNTSWNCLSTQWFRVYCYRYSGCRADGYLVYLYRYYRAYVNYGGSIGGRWSSWKVQSCGYRCSSDYVDICSEWQEQYQWASYSCTNYDWIFQPDGSPSDPSSSCTQTSTWWESSP